MISNGFNCEAWMSAIIPNMKTHLTNLTNINIKITGVMSNENISNLFTKNNTITNKYNLTTVDISKWNISDVQSIERLLGSCRTVTNFYAPNTKVQNVKTLNYMFNNAFNLIDINMWNWNLHNITSLNLWMYAPNVTNMNMSNWNLCNVNNLISPLKNIPNIKDLQMSNWKLNNVTIFNNIFSDNPNIKALNVLNIQDWYMPQVQVAKDIFRSLTNVNTINLSNWKLDSLVVASNLFAATAIKELNACNLYAPQLNNISNCFSNSRINDLNIQGWTTNKITNFAYAFSNTNAPFDTIEYWDTSSAIDMTGIFNSYNGKDLNIANWNTNNVTTLISAFENLGSNINTLGPLNWNVNKVTNISNIFRRANFKNLIISDWNLVQPTVIFGGILLNQCPSLVNVEITNMTINTNFFITGLAWYCNNLVNANFSNWNIQTNTFTNSQYGICNKLKDLNLSNWKFTFKSTKYPFLNSLIAINLQQLNSLTNVDMSNWKWPIEVTSLSGTFANTKIINLNLSNWNTSGIKNMYNMFYNSQRLKEIKWINQWDMSNVNTIANMFQNCKNYVIDCNMFENWNTNNFNNLSCTFKGCSLLTNIKGIENWNTNNVTTLAGMFDSCGNLEGIDNLNWNLNKVNNISHTFFYCYNINNIYNFVQRLNSSALVNCNAPFITHNKELFQDNSVIDIYANWTTNNIVDLSMFLQYTQFTQNDYDRLANWNISNVKYMGGLFGHSFLQDTNFLSTWNTRSIMNINALFYNTVYLNNISGIENWNTDNVTTLGSIFENCRKLIDINLANWNLNKVNSLTGTSRIFYNCIGLKNITLPNTIKYLGSEIFLNCFNLTRINIPNLVVGIGNAAFSNCRNTEIYDFSKLNNIPTIDGNWAFNGIKSTAKIYVPISLYDKWKKETNWAIWERYIYPDYNLNTLTNLSITADNVTWKRTNTTIHVTETWTGTHFETGEIKDDCIITYDVISDEFDSNLDENPVERIITYTKDGFEAQTTIIQDGFMSSHYTINLNNRWQNSSIENPDNENYEGVYESNYGRNSNNSVCQMSIDVSGYDEFTILAYQSSEINYDFITARLDAVATRTTYDFSLKGSGIGSAISNISLDKYQEIKFTRLNGEDHMISICYGKDGSSNVGNDRGYILIPKNQ